MPLIDQERQALWTRLDRNGDGHVSMAEFGAVFFHEATSEGSGQVLGGENCDPFMQHPTNRGAWSQPPTLESYTFRSMLSWTVSSSRLGSDFESGPE